MTNTRNFRGDNRSITTTYKLVAVPSLLREGESKGHLETVTFIAAAEHDTHKWWSVNVGTYESDFSMIVSPELARHVVDKLRAGETVEFPNRYELEEVKVGSGGAGRIKSLRLGPCCLQC